MNSNVKKLGVSAIAFVLAGTLSFQLVSNHDMVASASVGTLTGIEEIRRDLMGTSNAYDILEIVPDRSEAELGYLIGGSEPLYYFDGKDLKGKSANATDPIPADYLVGSSKLTYGDVSLWDEDNHCWIGVEEKLNSFTTEDDRQTFMAFISKIYLDKLGNNADMKDVYAYSSDLYLFETGTLVSGQGNYNIQMNALEGAPTSGTYYIGTASNPAAIASGDNLTDISETGIYYKKVTDMASDGKLYTGYILVGDKNAVIEDAKAAKTTAKVVLNLTNDAGTVSSGELTSGKEYTVTPSLTGFGYNPALTIDSISYLVEVTYYSGTKSTIAYTSDTSRFSTYGLSFGRSGTDNNNLTIKYKNETDYQVIEIKVKADSLTLKVDGVEENGYEVYKENETIISGPDPTIASYNITYTANNPTGTNLKSGVDISPDSVLDGSSYTLKTPEIDEDTYIFSGWATESDRSVVYGGGQTITISSDLNLYGVWLEKGASSDTYNVIYHVNEPRGLTATNVPPNAAGISGSYTLGSPSINGYNFLGWATSASGSVVYNSGASITLNSNLELWGVWKSTYTLTYHSNGGTDVPVGTNVMYLPETLPEPSRAGYYFAGWFEDEAFEINAVPGMTLTENLDLYAKWGKSESGTGDGTEDGTGNGTEGGTGDGNGSGDGTGDGTEGGTGDGTEDGSGSGDGSESGNGQSSKRNAVEEFYLASLQWLFGEPMEVSAEESVTAPYPYYTLSYSVVSDESQFDSVDLQKAQMEFQEKYKENGFAFIDSNTSGKNVYLVPGLATYNQGKGNFSLVTSGTEYDTNNLATVLAAKSYGSFTNADYFRKYVFDLSEEEYDQLKIKVHTYTPAELNQMSADEINQLLGSMKMVSLSNGRSSGVGTRIEYVSTTNDFTLATAKALYASIVSMQLPTIVDASIGFTTSGSAISGTKKGAFTSKLVYALLQPNFNIFMNTDNSVSFPTTTKEWDDAIKSAIAYQDDLTGVNQFILSCYSDKLVSAKFSQMGLCTNTVGNTGFESVLAEIETENDYRAADTGSGYAQLDTGINYGRAIRHIINYTAQRVQIQKTAIRVLEIQPNVPSTNSAEDELTSSIVSTWVGGDITTDHITIDTMTVHEFVGHIEDLNAVYDLIYIGSDASSFNHEGSSSTYELAQNGDSVDAVKIYNMNTRNWDIIATNQQIYNYTDYTTTRSGSYIYRDTNPGTSSTVIVGVADGKTKLTTGTRNGVFYVSYGTEKRINDFFIYYNGYAMINTKYVGNVPAANQYHRVNQGGVIPVYNDQSMRGMIYTNIGDVTNVNTGLSGILRTDWKTGQIGTAQSELVNSWVRYAGYDISMEKYNALMDFVDASYPIVVSSRLYDTDSQGNRVVSTSTVDNSSYMYDFLNSTLSSGNVFSSDDVVQGGTSKFRFYVNRPKLTLTIHSFGPNDKLNASDNSGGVVHQLSKAEDGKFYLYYEFSLENLGAVSNDTLYTLRLYLDTNADGKFSEAYEELENLIISEKESGNSVAYNAIKTGTTYIARRELPSSYDGVITWDLQLEQNTNSMIRCSENGYTKILNGRVAEIKILQIMKSTDNNANLNLEWAIGKPTDNGSNTDNVYKVYHSLVYGTNGANVTASTANGNETFSVAGNGIYDDYHLDISSITTDTFMQRYSAGTLNIDQYDMLILGFSDMYQDIKADALYGDGGLIDFIESGKSVLFAHDTTSFWQYDTYWSYYMNRYIRNYVGMDTYGVTMAYTKQVENWQDYDLLRSGTAITPNDNIWKELYPTKTNGRYNYNTKNIAFKPGSGRTAAVPEVQGFAIQPIVRSRVTSDTWAWVNNTSYRNYYNFHPSYATNYTSMDTTNYVAQVNTGQITSYPFKLDSTFKVPTTHGQYYSLDLNADDDDDGETDVVVWYTLSNNGTGYYSRGGKDCVNNYYIYNKGNVTYTGVGHSGKSTTVMEAKLFINTMVAAYNAGTRDVKLSITDKDGIATDTLYEYVDMENGISFTEDIQRIYFTYSDPNIVKTAKNGAATFYMTKTGSGTVPASLTENGVTYQMRQTSVELPDSVRNRLYTEANGVTVNASSNKKDFYMMVQNAEGNFEYVSMDTLFESQSVYRCYNNGAYPNTLEESQNAWYVKCFNWNTETFELVRLNDQPAYGVCWWDVSNHVHLYYEIITTNASTSVIEFTNMKVYRKSDGALVDAGTLESDVIYYVEIPLNALRDANLVSYDITKNDFIVGIMPYYTTVNKFTNSKKYKYGNQAYAAVHYNSVQIFDLD